jgi:putative sigma-54 modulation protein
MTKNFITDGYTVSIIGKNVQLTDAIKNYILEKLSKVDRFATQIIDVLVSVEVQKLTHCITITMKYSHFNINVHAQTEDLYSAIDKATEKLMNLIKKYKSKLQSHKVQNVAMTDMNVNVFNISDTDEINDEIEEQNIKEEEELYKFHDIVAKEIMPLKTLTIGEAIMKIELSANSFLIFKGEEDQKTKVMYRRKDENLGLVELE